MRAYYSAPVADFLMEDVEYILGVLTRHSQFSVDLKQRNAWEEQIRILKNCLLGFHAGHIFFEYSIPRMGKRVDGILLIHGVVYVLEFKVGDSEYLADDIDQVLDYALDLKNFHEESCDLSIIPILIATEAYDKTPIWKPYEDLVYSPILANSSTLLPILNESCPYASSRVLDPLAWQNSAYKPTPTIIEATKALYAKHNVNEISRSEGGAINLSATTDAISKYIEVAKKQNRKIICFVTGVPGAGKTLAGLNIASQRLQFARDEHAVFLSGNGPLVKVLREALIRDRMSRIHNSGSRHRVRNAVTARVIALIQNIYHYRENALDNQAPLLEKVVIFDEAQRAWTEKQLSAFMKEKYGIVRFNQSEPRFLIGVMDRFPDWAVIVCLVGGGQEINTGEAGLGEWFKALHDFYPHWYIAISPNLLDREYLGSDKIDTFVNPEHTAENASLHLAVSVRSFRSEKVSGLVKQVLDLQDSQAAAMYQEIQGRYPIVLTRDLSAAKTWLRDHARGTERCGILASSGALRLRPVGINVRAEIDVVNWFLNGKSDVRSSHYLEEAATEFDVQGLEIDWACVAWDADLRYAGGDWTYKNFIGTRWQEVKSDERRKYLLNAYRVLLTRSRQGMVIFIPNGDPSDPTRKPEYYDSTYNYLRSIGIKVI